MPTEVGTPGSVSLSVMSTQALSSRGDTLAVKLAHVARDIKLAHSVFALPFALLAMFLAAADDGGRLPRWGEAGLIVLCMVFARTYAMAVNRWADAGIDAKNPRTAGRAIPAGRVHRGFMLVVAGFCGMCFLIAAGMFGIYDNPWPMRLALPVLLLLSFYSFTKRFTWLCHVFLGAALAASPIAAAIAIHPPFLARPEVYLLAAMVLCWVAGFDVIYALQDVEVDREHGLHSMPAKLGVEPALWISRVLHIIALVALGALAVLSPQLHHLFNLAVAATAALLVVEHGLIIKSPKHHLNTAFFTVNGVISLLLGAAGVVDVLATS